MSALPPSAAPVVASAGAGDVASAPLAGAGWRARVRRTPGGAHALQTGVFLLGLSFVLLGCALVVAPGPLTIPPVLLGLYIWSTEFRWADRMLERARAKARDAWRDAQRRPVKSALGTIAGLAAVGVGMWLAARYELVSRALALLGL